MEYLKIIGKNRINGEISLHGAKNSVLPILAATVLVSGESVIHNCPKLSDVKNTLKILKSLGAEVKRENDALIINTVSINKYEISEFLMREMRSSIIFLGSLSSRMGKSRLCLPGGCDIGSRPIDLHLKGLKSLGYNISFKDNNICCEFDKRKSEKIALAFPSVGATENIILSCVLMKGRTRLVNAAREPEIIDLCSFLNSAGAKISGAGTSVIDVEGVENLHSCEHTVISDRILASTIMSAAAITGGTAVIKKAQLSYLKPLFPAFLETGCEIYLGDGELKIVAPKKPERIKKLETKPYPGFPTDSQATLSAVLCKANGVSTIKETIFENRFKHIKELEKFGADVTVCDRIALIKGVKQFSPAKSSCTDLRGGAAIAIAALSAEGTSYISDIYHIDRGYESIENQFSLLGADVKRINNDKEEFKTKQ